MRTTLPITDRAETNGEIDPAAWLGFSKTVAQHLIADRDVPQKWHDDVFGESALLTVQAKNEFDPERRSEFGSFLWEFINLRLRYFIRQLMRGESFGDGIDNPCVRRARFRAVPTEQQIAELNAAIERLPADQRTAIVGVYLRRRTQQQQAAIQQVDQGTVARKLAKARSSLAMILR